MTDKEVTDNQTGDDVSAMMKTVTEQRITRKVIRRRVKVASEADIQDEDVEAPEPSPPVQRIVEDVEDDAAEEVKPKKRRLVGRAASPRATLKKIPHTPFVPPPAPEPPAQQAEPVVAPEPTPEKVEEGPRYRRIKVIGSAKDRLAEQPRDFSRQGGQAQREVVPVESNTGQPPASHARKEIIEFRNVSRAKGLKGGRKKRLPPGKIGKKTEITVPRAGKRVIRIVDAVSVGELAKRMSVKVGELIAKFMGMGMVVKINQAIDIDTASLVAAEFGFEIENVSVDAEDLLAKHEKTIELRPEDLTMRPPVVTVMGHVDHGKTSLLDHIRKSHVASGEAGGITQHIGAYRVQMDDGKFITFIDTPGHEAFTSMRARGAQVTDLVVLVVAADDGVMPQTKEAINHAQSAKVPIIVAINKIDKPGVNPDRIKKELTEFGMVPEEWGGDTIYVPVSAIRGDGVAQLLEFILLQAEVMELRANAERPAKGVILEASMDRKKGISTTVLVQDGSLREGDVVVAGVHFGKIRTICDDQGKRLKVASPSFAVELMGLSGVATAGDSFSVVKNEKQAKEISQLKYNEQRQKELAMTSRVSLDDLYQQMKHADSEELKIVVKADTVGSVDVLTKALTDLSTPKVSLKVIHGAVGGVSENDVMLASASGALVVAFHLRPTPGVLKLADQYGVEIRSYDIIYELTEEITKAMAGLLAPKEVEKLLGHAQVREIYQVPKAGTIAGCFVSHGKIHRSYKVRLMRDQVPIYSGTLKSLKRFKDDVREVSEGFECGIAIENFNDIKIGDVIEAFEIEHVTATLS